MHRCGNLHVGTLCTPLKFIGQLRSVFRGKYATDFDLCSGMVTFGVALSLMRLLPVQWEVLRQSSLSRVV